ncbi:MAG TPA: tRNA preQ1(34) S-adenosylmethionine ribosyltransferase-isomerase QueA [Steroidobacteraceae bacterium]|nr:tRNA preQ1(34) S-adenosylmethionine ribosyltransferase-isomerase QueA [Steroidobacteraceae bacterium]
MQLQDFAYDIPAERVAQTPLAERSASRLLTLEGRKGICQDRKIRDLPGLLLPGDLLVFNDTRVVAARLIGSKPAGGRVEVLLERALESNQAWVQLKRSKALREGLSIQTMGGLIRLLERCEDLWRIELDSPALDFFERWGDVPLPPYIKRSPGPNDRERYQSIFARERGAIAAPTASLHFDPGLIADLEACGIERAFITLHVGAGTFQPLRTNNLDEVVLHSERMEVGATTCDAIERTRVRGGRVVAVGTTVVRALESAALAMAHGGLVQPLAPFSGETRLFIRPGFQFRVVDALLTNFHVSESTLLMLVCAFAGREHTLAAYAHAIKAGYRFFSYGDAMFVTPQSGVAR